MQIPLNELKRRVGSAYAALSSCTLCPRNCRVNRLKNKTGICHIGKIAKVASHNLHTGEEPPISGANGSGTIFFSSCNLRCKFCQNYPISQLGHGEEASPQRLAEMMLSLQRRGAHNINIVTGSHVAAQFLAGLYLAKKGTGYFFKQKSSLSPFLSPIVWNSSGYDGMEALKLLDGVVDIYMPDIKYSSNDTAEHYSAAENYWEIVRPVIKEMHRQVGGLELDENGIARRGLLVRHLVLPGRLSGTEEVLKFIAEEISPKTYISLMSQYFPAYKYGGNDSLEDSKDMYRRLTKEEWQASEKLLHKYGLENGWVQMY